ncbi:MAG TPA: hypothetical protein VKY65_21975 [Alphaproteobacteria bacterium]|nr:hypothetical protein [Alphaproteobacteria bacterium]
MAWPSFRKPQMSWRAFGWAVIGVIPAIGAYALLAHFLGGAGVTSASVDRELGQSPLYAAIRQADPDAYARLRDTVVDARRDGTPKSELDAALRSDVGVIARKYIPIASGDALIEFARVMTLSIDEIGAKSADACFDFLFPRPGGTVAPITQLITPELSRRDDEALGAIIATGAASPQRVPTKDEVAPALGQVARQLAAKYGNAAVSDLTRLTSLDHGKACALTSSLYKEVLSLPRDQAVAVLRFMFAQNPAI